MKHLLSYDFCYKIALNTLRITNPCPRCGGSGCGPIAPDFIGDRSEEMTIGTCSACEHCDGTGIDPQEMENIAVREAEAGNVPKGILEFDLYENRDGFETAVHADAWKSTVCVIEDKLRAYLKYGHDFKTVDNALESIRNSIYDELNFRTIALYE